VVVSDVRDLVVVVVGASVVGEAVVLLVVGLGLGLDVFTLLLGFLVVVISVKDSNGSNEAAALVPAPL